VKKSIYRKEYKYFVEVLIEFRNKAGLLQIDLAKMLNVHQSYISKIETGQRRVDIIELREICYYVNTNLLEFTKELENKIKASNN